MPPVDAFLFLITASCRANPIDVRDIRQTRLCASKIAVIEKKRGGGRKEGRKEGTE